jgi:hypothetical protein
MPGNDAGPGRNTGQKTDRLTGESGINSQKHLCYHCRVAATAFPAADSFLGITDAVLGL